MRKEKTLIGLLFYNNFYKNYNKEKANGNIKIFHSIRYVTIFVFVYRDFLVQICRTMASDNQGSSQYEAWGHHGSSVYGVKYHTR